MVYAVSVQALSGKDNQFIFVLNLNKISILKITCFVYFQEGLVKGNMDKLTFFAMKSPDKLDRIGEYLEQRLSRDIYRQRYG